MNPPILLFDGVCNLCNGVVDFILRYERAPVLRFAALQSQAGQAWLSEFGFAQTELNSVILIEAGRAYRESEAALRVCRYLKAPFPLALGLLRLPEGLRDPLYRALARNRYRWFGKRATCRLPTPEERARFLG
ncbi:MAG: thiol-disulfide oxidoreductase DCC family protein [Anaerolineales bacterium]